MKTNSDFEQSKMLAEFLSVESADLMFVHSTDLEGNEHYDIDFRNKQPLFEGDIPCWSLAALLDIIPMVRIDNFFDFDVLSMKWNCMAFPENYQSIETDNYDNPVDACIDMIVRLKKHNLI